MEIACPICGANVSIQDARDSARRHRLKLHMQYNHKNVTEDDMNYLIYELIPKKNESKVKEYICFFCKADYQNTALFNAHSKEHSGSFKEELIDMDVSKENLEK